MAAQQSSKLEEQERLRLQALSKELRGKDYGYDFKGDIVVLTKMDPDKLPPAQLQLTYKIVDPAKHDPPGKRASARQGMPAASATARKLVPSISPSAAAAAPGQARSTAAASSSSQLPAARENRRMSNAGNAPDFAPAQTAGEFVRSEAINLQPGTVLRRDTMVRQGPQREAVGRSTMTKAEYYEAMGIVDGYEETEVEDRPPSAAGFAPPSGAARPDTANGSRPGSQAEGRRVSMEDASAVLAAILRPTSRELRQRFVDATPVPPQGRQRNGGSYTFGTSVGQADSESSTPLCPCSRAPTVVEEGPGRPGKYRGDPGPGNSATAQQAGVLVGIRKAQVDS